MCLLWGADLRLRPSWQMSTIQYPRKMWLATGSLLTVWWRMLVSGVENGAAPRLPALSVTRLPLPLVAGRGRSAAGQLSFGICSILCCVSGPGFKLESFPGKLCHVSSLRLSSGHSGWVLILSSSYAARTFLSSPLLAGGRCKHLGYFSAGICG